MTPDPYAQLSARERQIMDVVYQLGAATAVAVRQGIPDPPTDATVRSALRVLEDKGWLTHDLDRGRFVYRATRPRGAVRRGLLRHLVDTFYEGSSTELMAALLDGRQALSAQEKERVRELLESLESEESA